MRSGYIWHRTLRLSTHAGSTGPEPTPSEKEEAGPGFRLVAKSGSSPDGEGWLVGWVETQGGGCTFALHLAAPGSEEMARIRPGLARDFLRQAVCIPR